MAKQRWLWFINCVLIVNWLGLAVLLIREHADWRLELFVALTIVLSGLIIWLQHRSMPRQKIRIIRQLANDIEQRRVNLLEPLPLENLPEEVVPLVSALNHLLGRETERLQMDHAFSSEASHELRTPLAGIRLQAQIAQRTHDPAERENANNNIIKAIDRCTHLIEQLLTLSRLTRQKAEFHSETVNLEELCRKTTAAYLPVR